MRDHSKKRPILVRWPKPTVNLLGVSPAGLRRVLMQTVGGAAMLVWDVHSAWGACSPAAANSVVAICSGANTTRYGTGLETNGDITVSSGASLDVAGAYAIYFGSLGSVDNAGTITATSSTANAYGLFAKSTSVTVGANTGNISASAAGSGAASGIRAATFATLTNSTGGTISGTGNTGTGYGVYAGTTATVTSNAGTLSGTSNNASGAGVAYGVYAGSNAAVTNVGSGSVTALAAGSGAAYGVFAMNAATVTNASTSSITVNASGGGEADGVFAYWSATVTNHGLLSATGTRAHGVLTQGDISVTNYGRIAAAATTGVAIGLYGNGGFATLNNSGAIAAASQASAYGISADTADVTNSGSITGASSLGGSGFGVWSYDAAVGNSGSISASSASGAAYGVYGLSSAIMSNTGTLTATSGTGAAYGVYSASVANVTNMGVLSTSSSSGNAYAVRSNNARTSVNNSGSISATSASGLSYGLYLSGGATSLTNSGSISGQTASVYAGARVANLLNWQGGNAADAKSTALTWSGTLPSQYTLGVVSPTRYGQIWFSNPSGTMAMNLDSSSTLALGSYAKAVTGVNASAISGTTGTMGLLRWQLSLSDSSNLYWDLLVTPNGVATGETKLASALNQSFMPYFFGGTLQIDSQGSTLSDNFVLDASSTNTVALGGNSASLNGVFSNATGSAGRINFSGGTATLTGTNT